jgi:hypothetical protein
MPLTAEMIRAFSPSVKLICEAGTGYNNIDLIAAREKGIGVCNVPTYATEAMAHIAITMVMALSCSLVPQAKALAVNDRTHMQQCHLGSLAHFELSGKTLGLIGGLGTIGLRVAAIATALGMRVVASSRSAPLGLRDDRVEVVSLEGLLSQSDFVSVHCPLNAHTKGLVDGAAIARMKPTAFVINTARGAIIDQPALVEALRAKRIAAATSAPRRFAAVWLGQCDPDAAHWVAALGVATARGRHDGRQHRRLPAGRAVQHRHGNRDAASEVRSTMLCHKDRSTEDWLFARDSTWYWWYGALTGL